MNFENSLMYLTWIIIVTIICATVRSITARICRVESEKTELEREKYYISIGEVPVK